MTISEHREGSGWRSSSSAFASLSKRGNTSFSKRDFSFSRPDDHGSRSGFGNWRDRTPTTGLVLSQGEKIPGFAKADAVVPAVPTPVRASPSAAAVAAAAVVSSLAAAQASFAPITETLPPSALPDRSPAASPISFIGSPSPTPVEGLGSPRFLESPPSLSPFSFEKELSDGDTASAAIELENEDMPIFTGDNPAPKKSTRRRRARLQAEASARAAATASPPPKTEIQEKKKSASTAAASATAVVAAATPVIRLATPDEFMKFRFSQTGITNQTRAEESLNSLATSIKTEGFRKESAINVVKMPDGRYTTYDHRRLVAAMQLVDEGEGRNIWVNEYSYDAPVNTTRDEASLADYSLNFGVRKAAVLAKNPAGIKRGTWGFRISARMRMNDNWLGRVVIPSGKKVQFTSLKYGYPDRPKVRHTV